MLTPRIEINIAKIAHNAKKIVWGKKWLLKEKI